jgi:redox-sensitive bicupin YhaK (pirin superfamily)
MITVRRAADRGSSRLSWLDSRHTFSFSDYHDPAHMGFSVLRVINEDRVGPGAGFGTHGHRDMEIVSYVLEGELQHRDSMGNGSPIRPGDVQRMSAGTGVLHSEYNGSTREPVHFLQIWLLPARGGIEPSYEQKSFPAAEREGRLRRIASPEGSEGSVTLHQDASIFSALLGPGQKAEHRIAPGRKAWVQVARGEVELDGQTLSAGDGAAISGESAVTLAGREPAEVLLFDLP